MINNERLIGLRDKLIEVEDCLGDIECDIEGLDAMADSIKFRPAIAVINDLAALGKELREAFEIDGKKLYEILDAETIDIRTLENKDEEVKYGLAD